MQLENLIAEFSRPAAYPFPISNVTVCQTHISVVFLAGDFAFKIKKPVRMGFLDFSTIGKRHHDCLEEVRLNRRLAGDVYLGIVPVCELDETCHIEGTGLVVDWAVKMRRLPGEATLEQRLLRNHVSVSELRALAATVAQFHAKAEHGPHISEFGSFESVARNARESFQQASAQAGLTVSQSVFDRVRELTDEALAKLRPLIETRSFCGMTCDTHGDLRLDHVYLLSDEAANDRWVIIDCIEFNERFRFADPIADAAFLVMDLLACGRTNLARSFIDTYCESSGDTQGRSLFPFYAAYRAVVRAKVEGLKQAEHEVPGDQKASALAKAKSLWLLALGILEEVNRRPALALVGGLPGSGKSTLTINLAQAAGFDVIRSDVVRKELAGISPNERPPATLDLYTPAWNQRVYEECLRRAKQLLFEGKRVVVDATFREERFRRIFLDESTLHGVPAAFIICQVQPALARGRLSNRSNDASDADGRVYQRLTAQWEEPGPATIVHTHAIRTETPAQSLANALRVLRTLVSYFD
jgi:aminoglycoside phosphotransferase family enzyme/predicted kinase